MRALPVLAFPFLLAAASICGAQDDVVTGADAPPVADEVIEETALPVEADPLDGTEQVLPTGYPVTRYADLWRDSPFNREVVRPVTTTLSSTFGRNLVLEGLVNDATLGPIAYLRDTRENKSIVVSSKPGENDQHPYHIVSAEKDRDPGKTKVVVSDGNETAEIGFEVASLTQAIQAPQQTPRAQTQGRDPNDDPELRERLLRQQQAKQSKSPASARQSSAGSGAPADASKPSPPEADEFPSDPLDKPNRRRVPLPNPRN